MQKYLTLKVVGAIMSAIATATGYALDITQVTNLEFKWWPFITFVVFVGFISWIIYDLYKENANLKDIKPKIEVKTINKGDNFYLEVKNNGGAAEFESQIKIIEDNTGAKRDKLYLGYWQIGANSKATIMNIDKIKIAHCETVIYPPDAQPLFPFSMSLHLYYYDKSSAQLKSWQSTAWTTIQGVIKPEYVLQITISSTPSLREGKFVRNYKLELSGLTELSY